MKICSNHSEYQVPLLSTMAFNGAEYWCPYCGASEGMFGAGETIKPTEKLLGRASIYREHSAYYLGANGRLACVAFDQNGCKIDRKDFSPAMMDEVRKFLKENPWSYNVKASKLLKQDILEFDLVFNCLHCNLEKTCDQAYKTKQCLCCKWVPKEENKDEV